MRKITAIEAFGSASTLARAIGIAPQAVYQWPEHLSPKVADRVVAAALRSGINPDIFRPLPSAHDNTSPQAQGPERESA